MTPPAAAAAAACACSNENTKGEEGQVRFLIYCLEHAARLADEKREWHRHTLWLVLS